MSDSFLSILTVLDGLLLEFEELLKKLKMPRWGRCWLRKGGVRIKNEA